MEKQSSTAGTAGRGLTQSVPDPCPPGKPVPQASTGAAPAWGQVLFVNQPWYMLNIQHGGPGAPIEILEQVLGSSLRTEMRRGTAA